MKDRLGQDIHVHNVVAIAYYGAGLGIVSKITPKRVSVHYVIKTENEMISFHCSIKSENVIKITDRIEDVNQELQEILKGIGVTAMKGEDNYE